jgi:sec-independent protein translocase protein TatC
LSLDDPQPLTGHLEELRSRLISVFVFFFIFSAASYHYVDPILNWLAKPVGHFIFTDPTEALFVRIKLALCVGGVAVFPIFLYHAYRFVSIALEKRERSIILFVIPFAIALFLAGTALGLFVIVPIAADVLLKFQSPTLIPMISVQAYLSFLTWMILGFGILFQLPLVIVVLGKTGVVEASSLSRYRKHVLLGIVIAAAVLTPGPDVFSQLVLMIPTYLLFEISLLLVRYWK